jgi:hypothetical protein
MRHGVGDRQLAIYAQRSALAHLHIADAAERLGTSVSALSQYTNRQTTGPKFLYKGQTPEGVKQRQRAARAAAQAAERTAAAHIAAKAPVTKVVVAGAKISLPLMPWSADHQPSKGQ